MWVVHLGHELITWNNSKTLHNQLKDHMRAAIVVPKILINSVPEARSDFLGVRSHQTSILDPIDINKFRKHNQSIDF
jgi:hypothetical protein